MREFEGNARANREREQRGFSWGSWHFHRRSKATKAKGESLGESGNDWGSWAAVGDTGTHHMGWGDTWHTHTYTRARGLGRAPRGCWGAPRCSGMHRGALGCTAVLWNAPRCIKGGVVYFLGGSGFSGGGGL